MARPSAPVPQRYTLLAILVAVALAWARWKGWIPQEEAKPPRSEQAGRPAPQTSPAPRANPAPVTGAWEEWADCSLVEDRGNDGDSFVVQHQGQRRTLRLYFADCPEKYRHQYNGDRLADQGRYFGGLSEAETVSLGEEARDFALDRLRTGKFTVQTRWEQVFDSERYYAFVRLPQGDLGQLLVQEGLARIYTKGENRPQGTSAAAEKQRLQALEREARQARRGGWGRP